jgi:hypothetical protein
MVNDSRLSEEIAEAQLELTSWQAELKAVEAGSEAEARAKSAIVSIE